jgi:CheY-like chemotaxis protein
MENSGVYATGDRVDELANMAGRVALVADDEPAVLRPIRAILGSIGYEVITASNGLEVVEWVRERALSGARMPELVISDVNMPWLAGPEALLAVIEHLHQTAVIVMTGHISPDLEGRVRPLRARVVAKPELMRNLRDVVRQSDPRVAH